MYKFILLSFLFSSATAFNIAVADSLDRPTLEQQIPLALEGYDAITYFDLTGAKLGTDSHQAVYRGKRYLFSNSDNQQKFADDPQRYLPQFDGHCAQSMAMDKVVPSNPAVYTLEEGKLYMFKDEAAKKKWSLEPERNLLAAKKSWSFNAEKREKQIGAKNLWKTKNQVKLFTF
jgi:YHS domain-containing protein